MLFCCVVVVNGVVPNIIINNEKDFIIIWTLAFKSLSVVKMQPVVLHTTTKPTVTFPSVD